jgi:hypothetical protein
VFICHASEDKGRIVRRLAQDLDALGADVWIDEWELHPGDSLRQRLTQGIEDCQFFVIVLSARSINKPWVTWELDAGTIRAIEGTATIVPIVYGKLPISDLPVDLRSKVVIPFPAGSGKAYEQSFERLARLVNLSHTRWSLKYDPVDVYVAHPNEVRIEVAWTSRTSERFDWTETRTSYTAFVSGLTIENHGREPVHFSSLSEEEFRRYGALADMYLARRVVHLAQVGQLGGSPRHGPLRHAGEVSTSGAEFYESLRSWDRLRWPAVATLDPGRRIQAGLELGTVEVTHVEETGTVDAVSVSGLAHRDVASAYVSETCKELTRAVENGLERSEVVCALSVSAERRPSRRPYVLRYVHEYRGLAFHDA